MGLIILLCMLWNGINNIIKEIKKYIKKLKLNIKIN